MPHRRCAIALLVLCAAARAEEAGDAVRAEFRAALEHAADAKAPEDSAALKAYVLHPYLEAGRLRTRLARTGKAARDPGLEQQVRGFLKAHADEPVARDLMRDYLGFLGERGAWLDFQIVAPTELTDISLRCYALDARLALKQTAGLRDAALDLWLREAQAPPACAPIFQWLDSPDRVGDGELEQRARLAASERVPLPLSVTALRPERRALLELWKRLEAAPERELKRYIADPPRGLPAPPDPSTGDALLDAFDRVSKRDSRVAKPLYPPLRDRGPFTEGQKWLLLRSYALGLAYDFDPDALQAFQDLPDSGLDLVSREWRVRIALRLGEHALALKWLEAMPAPQKDEPRWRYWRARMLERAQPKEAKALLEGVAKEREYYAFLAAERLGRKPDLRPQPAPADPRVQAALLALPPVQRARELVACELTNQAMQELRFAMRERSVAEKVQAAQLVTSWGWYEPAVRLLSEHQQWDEVALRFPLPYAALVEKAAKDTELPPEWIYAVMRTESLYDPRALSRTGAQGLLQLQPATARQIAKRIGMPRPTREDLFRPEVNIALGARYLREMEDRLGQRLILTLAAYNAGPLKAPYWVTDHPLDAEIWVETIPFNETRQYVQRALSNLVILSWRRTGTPAQLLPLLQPIATPRQDGPP